MRLFFTAFCILALYVINAPSAFAQTKTIKFESVPSGATAKIKFYSWGRYTDEYECVTPCEYKTDLHYSYDIDFKKDGFASSRVGNKDPFLLNRIPENHEHKNYLKTLYSETNTVKVQKVGNVETYRINLESKSQQDLRKAKLELAKHCTEIFIKHFKQTHAESRPCRVETPALPRKFKKKEAICQFTYDLTETGQIKYVRHFDCTHDSLVKKFNSHLDPKSNSRWLFFPKIVNGKPVGELDLSIEINFFSPLPTHLCPNVVAKYENQPSHKAAPCKQDIPKYPQKKYETKETKETCHLSFDINTVGRTENVEIESCTSENFAKLSKKAVQTWLYVPKQVDGQATRVTGKTTSIQFELLPY